MKADLEIECKNPENIFKSLEPDIDNNSKFSAEFKVNDNKLKITVSADDITGLLAGINSYLRLVKTVIDLEEIK